MLLLAVLLLFSSPNFDLDPASPLTEIIDFYLLPHFNIRLGSASQLTKGHYNVVTLLSSLRWYTYVLVFSNRGFNSSAIHASGRRRPRLSNRLLYFHSLLSGRSSRSSLPRRWVMWYMYVWMYGFSIKKIRSEDDMWRTEILLLPSPLFLAVAGRERSVIKRVEILLMSMQM